MSRRVLLLVDLSHQIYRAAAAHPDLSCPATGEYTGGLYGFMASLAKAVRDSGATDCVACLDSKPYLRSRDYPDYKRLRAGTMDPQLRERYDATEPQVRALLALAGIPEMWAPGFESDDMVAAAVLWHRTRFDRIVAASNDSDLFQLFRFPSFSLYNSKGFEDAASLARLPCQMTAEEHLLAKALQGTHNDVAGIPGVGPVKALQAVRDPARMRPLRSAHGAVIDRNLALIRLPHPELPRLPLPGRTGGFSSRELYRWAAAYDIDVTMSMVESFDQLSRGRA